MDDKQFRVLLIEDNPGDARLILEFLKDVGAGRYHVELADRLSVGRASLAANGFDAVLLDLSLPDSSGLDTFRAVHASVPATPVVVLTGLNDESVAVQAMHEGAQDYLPKGALDGILLVRALRYAIERQRAADERLRLLSALEAERNWLQAVIDSSPAAIILVEDPGGTRIRANRRAEELFGFALLPDTGVTQYGEYICHPSGRPYRYDELATVRSLQGETVLAEEEVIYRPDGQEMPIVVSASPLRDSAGAISGAVVVLEDITHLKEFERLKDEWGSVIAHDLRQPVSVILRYATQLAEEGDRTSPQQAAIDHVLSGARQVSRMTADLMDLSRLEAQRLALERQRVDLPSLIAGVLERLGDVARGRQVTTEITGTIPPVSADPGRLEQVLSNLISNAAKYGVPGTEIRVALARRTGVVQVSVMNYGVGIPPEEIPDLFTRFRRAREMRGGRVEGLGLGLYISKGLIEAHGGNIWVDSIPGQTTTFHFTLPTD